MNTETQPEYTVDYFIAKFEAIPEEKWGEGSLVANELSGPMQCCALGHLGVREYEAKELTDEIQALYNILNPHFPAYNTSIRHDRVFSCIHRINDGAVMHSNLGATPRQRMLEALRIAKEASK